METRKKYINIALIITALLMTAYHALYLFFPIVNALMHQNIHLGFAMVILGLVCMRKSSTTWVQITWLCVTLISIVCVTYIHINADDLQMFAGFPNNTDIVIGVSLAVLVLVLSYIFWGPVFPLLALIGVSYALFGHLLGGPLNHPYIEPTLVLSNINIGFEGIYGMMLNTSANVIFFFMIFGALFEVIGLSSFFSSIGHFIGRKIRGGAAIGSVASSSLLGMCTGGSLVNVALAGSFTLPMMTQAHFKPEIAGGIEACSSTGGGLTPPVMGIAIFIMASFLNMSYIQLVPAAIIPAVIFYIGLIAGVILIVQRDNIPMCHMDYDLQAIKIGAPVFIIPICVLCYMLFSYYAPAYAAFWTCVILVIVSLFRKETRFTFKRLLFGLKDGCESMAALAIVMGVIGIFVSMLGITNAGPKLSTIIQILSGGYMLPALFLTMILCLLLGCALPAPVAYMIVAIIVAPGMKDMGVSTISTHLFCFYFSFLSNVTPPVAGSAMMAARMLNCSFMKTSWEAFKLSLPFFVVPYFAIFNPIVILQAQAPVDAAVALVMLVVSAVSICFATWGYFKGHLSVLERVLFTASAVVSTISGLLSGQQSLTLGILGFIIFTSCVLYRMKFGVKSPLFPKISPAEMECVVD